MYHEIPKWNATYQNEAKQTWVIMKNENKALQTKVIMINQSDTLQTKRRHKKPIL